jgi:hypothetical protein
LNSSNSKAARSEGSSRSYTAYRWERLGRWHAGPARFCLGLISARAAWRFGGFRLVERLPFEGSSTNTRS